MNIIRIIALTLLCICPAIAPAQSDTSRSPARSSQLTAHRPQPPTRSSPLVAHSSPRP